jgi:hypothetical protein
MSQAPRAAPVRNTLISAECAGLCTMFAAISAIDPNIAVRHPVRMSASAAPMGCPHRGGKA